MAKNFKKGYIYILSNTHQKDILKIGITNLDPSKRALTLTRQTGTLGEYTVEWWKEVENAKLTEDVVHYKLSQYHYTKEYFKLPVVRAVRMTELIIKHLFETMDILYLEKEGDKAEWRFARKLRNRHNIKRDVLKNYTNIFEKIKKLESNLEHRYNKKAITKWCDVLPTLKYPFAAKLVELCLHEKKLGSPRNRQFINYKKKYYGYTIDLLLHEDYLEVQFSGKPSDKYDRLNIKQDISELKTASIKVINKAAGFNLQVKTLEQFIVLCHVLYIGGDPTIKAKFIQWIRL